MNIGQIPPFMDYIPDATILHPSKVMELYEKSVNVGFWPPDNFSLKNDTNHVPPEIDVQRL